MIPTSVGASPMQSIYTIAKIFTNRLQPQTPGRTRTATALRAAAAMPRLDLLASGG
jgi:hypothetical protein